MNLLIGSFIGLVLATALAIGKALLAVGAIPANMWDSPWERFQERGRAADRELCTHQGCPEPGCPSPFPGICEDS